MCALAALLVVILGGCASVTATKSRSAPEVKLPPAPAPAPRAAVRANVEQPSAKAPSTGKGGGLAERQEREAKGVDAASPGKRDRPAGKSSSKESSGYEIDEPRFQKHDHAQYLYEIKKKAIDVVNRHESSADLVMLCQDSTTEQWTVNAYKKDRKSYSFVVYSWDPVDNRFKETMQSGQLSMTGWKNHLRYSRSSKNCSTLKGSDR